MTTADLTNRILTRLDETGAGYYSPGEVVDAANEGQRLLALLTLCNESSGYLFLNPAQTFYSMLGVFPDWLLPLRVRNMGGAKVQPARLADMDAANPAWQATAGTPGYYAHLGFDLLAIDQQPAGATDALYVTYARSPVDMAGGASAPDVPEEYQPALADYAIPRLRAKEGGSEFTKSLEYFDRFLAAAKKLGDYVRARSQSQLYDRGPFELRAFDKSRAIERMRKGANNAK